MARRGVSIALAALGFAAGGALAGALLGERDDSLAAAKLAVLAADPDFDSIDTLFLGASLLYYQVDPEAFDRRMAELGAPGRSFNLSIEAIAAPEILHILDEVLQHKPPALRRIVFSMWSERTLQPADRALDRVTRWHDLDGALLAARLEFDSDRTLESRTRRALIHLQVLLNRIVHLGRTQNRLAHHLERTESVRERRSARREQRRRVDLGSRGFVRLEDLQAFATGQRRRGIDAMRAELVDDPDRYRQAVEKIVRQSADHPELSPARLLVVQKIVARCEAAGVAPVFTIGPALLSGQFILRTARREGVIPYLLDFERPDLFPDYYAIENRFDYAHLSGSITTRFSEQLAEQIYALLRGAP